MPPVAIPGLGSADVAPLVNREFDPRGASLTPEDYFVLTRVDGRTPIKQLLLISGFAQERAVSILVKLRESGAIYLPGETPKKPAPPPPPKPVDPRREFPSEGSAPREFARESSSARRAFPNEPSSAGKELAQASSSGPKPALVITIDEKLLDEPCDLSVEQKRAILTKHATVKQGTLFDILDLAPDVDKKTIKRAYFKLSKEFHPDRFYGKKLGSFEPRLGEIFKAATQAYELLDDDAKRAEYVARLAGAKRSGPQTPAEKSAELYEHAVQREVLGDLPGALKLFAAALKLDPQVRYLKRAAEAALKAQELRSAEEYATKAAELDPRDATAHRTLARVFRAAGRTGDARRELETAHRLDPENAHIAAELDELSSGKPRK